MKNRILLVLVGFVIINCPSLLAQDWAIGGNALSANAKFGSTTKRNIFFVSGNKIWGTLTKDGDWGFGTTAPNVRFHINSDSGESPFRVQVNGASKLYVHSGGGVSIGSSLTPPSNGLYVSGNAGIGTTSPAVKLHVVGGTDISPSGGGFIVSGSVTGANIGMDDNEIMARNNGAVSKLFFNNNGGDVIVNGAGAGGFVVGASAPESGIRTTIIEPTNSALILGTLNGVSSYLTVNRPTTSNSTETVRIRDNGSTFATFNTIAEQFQLTLTGSAVASGVWQNSDKRIKKDIKPVTNAIDNLMKLKPSVYYFKTDDEKYKYLNLPKELQFGLIAQELKEVFPNMVRESKTKDEDGKERPETVNSVNYTELIPVLIKGMQEQQDMIVALQQRIDQLESALSSASNSNAKASTIAGAVLEQNQPNPFNQSTIIRYQIPQGTSGQINIYDNKGSLMKSLRATTSGQATVNANDLKPGTYTYTLLVNGKLVSSKKMVVLN